jgi:nucleotide-binding universal stress UspA family protein
MIPPQIPDIKKILYATDLSQNARYAFSYAMGLANKYGAGITILHVLSDVSPFGDSLVINVIGEDKWKDLRKGSEQRIIEELRGRLADFCEEVSKDLPECPFITDDIIVEVGNPVDEIMNLVDKGEFDIVVMGAHGHGLIGDAMMGSISRKVVRRSKTPVLVVRLPDE